MGLDTKTYWLAGRQSQCDFDFDSNQKERMIIESPRESRKKGSAEVLLWLTVNYSD
jgi:hypothetical protein